MTLAEWMKLAKQDDAAVAARAGVTRTTISRIRRGITPPSIGLAKRLHELSEGKISTDSFLEAAQ